MYFVFNIITITNLGMWCTYFIENKSSLECFKQTLHFETLGLSELNSVVQWITDVSCLEERTLWHK